MTLPTFWFILIAVLWIGYLFMEGFDLGVGMHMKLLARNEQERRLLLNTIGPVWDGNEVWLITAGGAGDHRCGLFPAGFPAGARVDHGVPGEDEGAQIFASARLGDVGGDDACPFGEVGAEGSGVGQVLALGQRGDRHLFEQVGDRSPAPVDARRVDVRLLGDLRDGHSVPMSTRDEVTDRPVYRLLHPGAPPSRTSGGRLVGGVVLRTHGEIIANPLALRHVRGYLLMQRVLL